MSVEYDPLAHQVGGGHYKDWPIQPWELIFKNDIPYGEGNAIKYVCRYPFKNGRQDLEKAIHYLDLVEDGTASWGQQASLPIVPYYPGPSVEDFIAANHEFLNSGQRRTLRAIWEWMETCTPAALHNAREHLVKMVAFYDVQD